MIIKKLVSPILSNFLTKYIQNLNPNKLKLSLFSGHLSLDNLQVQQNCLLEHQIPIEIHQGTIKKMFFSIPYAHLKSNPSLIEIENLFILGKFNTETMNNSYLCHTQQLKEIKTLNSTLQQQNISQNDFKNGLLESILENFQFKISNIHIIIEHEIHGNKISFGIIIPLVQILTTDENGNSIQQNNFKNQIHKRLIISNLSLYINTKCNNWQQSINTTQFDEIMMNSMNSSDHQFVLRNYSFHADYIHNKDKAEFSNIINIVTPTIKFIFNNNQYNIIRQLMIDNSKYTSKQFYNACDRPDSYPEKDNDELISLKWWNYLRKCVEKQKYLLEFDPNKALIFLRNRKEVISQIQKSNQDECFTELKHKYGNDLFLMFQYYFNQITTNEDSDIIELSEIQEFVQNKKTQSYIDSWNINIALDQIQTEISFDNHNHSYLLRCKQFEFLLNKYLDGSFHFNTLLQSININDEYQNTILSYGSKNDNALKIKSNLKQSMQILIQPSKSELHINPKWFKILKKIKQSKLLLLSKFKNKIDITLISPIIICSFQNCKCKFNFGTMKIASKNMGKFNINCNNMEIKINKFHFICPTSYSIQLDCTNNQIKADIDIQSLKIHLHRTPFSELKAIDIIHFPDFLLLNQANIKINSLKLSLFEDDKLVLFQYCFEKSVILYHSSDGKYELNLKMNSAKGVYNHENLIYFSKNNRPCIDFT